MNCFNMSPINIAMEEYGPFSTECLSQVYIDQDIKD